MKHNSIFKSMWTDLVFDPQLRIVEIVNFDSRPLFGCLDVAILKGRSLQELAEMVGLVDRSQIKRAENALRVASDEQRMVYVEYISTISNTQSFSVAAHAEPLGDGVTCLHVMVVDDCDMRMVRCGDANKDQNNILQEIHDNLPVGLEVFDRNGYLVDINSLAMTVIGVDTKNKIIGSNIFDNPNISDQVKATLRSGENVHFATKYAYQRIGRGYNSITTSDGIDLDIIISVVKDCAGEVDKYLLIAQDVTESNILRHKYESLYLQMKTILNTLPVGVGVYSNDGVMIFPNQMLCSIFGADYEKIKDANINMFDNPAFPQELKQATKEGRSVNGRFAYDFNTIAQSCYVDGTRKLDGVRMMECSGTPIVGHNGNLEGYIFVVEDITESAITENVLEQSRRKTEMAIKAADITLWEFDIKTQLFTSENEPLNDFDSTKNLTVADYLKVVHTEDLAKMAEFVERMVQGEDFTCNIEERIHFPGVDDWQYCAINVAPYEKDETGKVIKYVGSRKNNTELHKKRLLQEKILNSIPLPILIKDIEDSFKYVFSNEESTRMFGTRELQSVYDVLDEEQSRKIQQTDMEVFVTGNPYYGKERIVLKDGRIYDTIVRKSIIIDGDKRLLLNVRWDESLQNDLERRSKMLTISNDVLNAYSWSYDPETDKLNYDESFDKRGWNTKHLDRLTKFIECIHPEDRMVFRDAVDNVLETGGGDFAVEYRVDLLKNGVYGWWECRGVVETTMRDDVTYKFMYGIDVNIESHKQTELMLIKTKEEMVDLIRQNNLVLNNTNSGLAFITPDYIVQWENISKSSVSLSFEAYKRGELCYKSAHNRTTPCDNCVLQRAMHSHSIEMIKFSLSDNRAMEITATPVMNTNDPQKLEGVVIRMDDITERERMIAELQHAKQLAEQSDKLKSAFLANMSHEIRTPLNAIVGFSNLLMTTDDEVENEEYIQIINNNNELLLKLINDILDLSKIESGALELKYEVFDMAEYFGEMLSTMKHRVVNPDVRLVGNNPYSSCNVNIDRNRVAQILTNYVTNAIKYTPKGFIEVGYECWGDGLRIFVKDSGIGIADEKKSKVFHRFEKLDEFAQGTGLGLSICKAIAESMGGAVGFESVVGEGSLFWAVLPCEVTLLIGSETPIHTKIDVESSVLSNASDCSETAAMRRQTILVVEDIASNYLLVSAILRKKYELIHAVNGRDAVDIVRSRRVDLVLMDMKMPVMDGLTATSEIRKFNVNIPIIALTAHAFESDRVAALESGCSDYLVKPVDRAKLLEVLSRYC